MSRKSKEVPLQTSHYVRIDKDTGLEILVTRNQRGVLCVKTSHYGAHNIRAFPSISPRKRLEEFRDHLRNHLERLGLPSDRTPNWIKLPESEWQPLIGPFDPNLKPPYSISVWLKRVEDLTEPLSQGRRAGELLWHLNHLLSRPFVENDLWLISQLMEHYFSYQVGGRINQFAIAGSKAVKARAAGPLARRRRSTEARELIRQQAEAFWQKHPLYKSQLSNTAEHICQSVNDELRKRALLPKSGKALSRKTIADHISAACRGKKAATG